MKNIIICLLTFLSMSGNLFAQDKALRDNEMDVFKAFPDTWSSFLEINEEEVFERIEALERLTTINDTVFCIKLMNLAIGASLDSDGPAYFHTLLHEKLKDERMAAAMFWVLARIGKGDVMRFWQFYWSSIRHEEDGGAGEEESYKEDFDCLKAVFSSESSYGQVVKAMCIAYEYFTGGVRFMSNYPYRLGWFGVEGK